MTWLNGLCGIILVVSDVNFEYLTAAQPRFSQAVSI